MKLTMRVVTVVVLAILAAPLASEAQQAGRMYRIGYLLDGSPPDQTPSPALRALEETLRDLGYVEGRNLVFERRFSEGNAERFSEFATEMVQLKVDCMIAVTTPAALAVKLPADSKTHHLRRPSKRNGRGATGAACRLPR